MIMIMAQTETHENPKSGICPEFSATTNKLENITINLHKGKFAHNKFLENIL